MISALLTDFYQLTMAYGYWKLGLHERETVFHLIFRKHPFHGNYAVNCGLATAIDFLNNWKFEKSDLEYLRGLKTPEGTRLFPQEFLQYLEALRFSCDVDAIPEGTVVFTNEPLVRIRGSLIQGQLIESTLLNLINFQTLIATKASRVFRAAEGDPVIEFGLRRCQGPDGAISASRASYIGGCIATSNTLAGKLFDIPVRGTHAHSWVTAFPNERTAFSSYAHVMPKNCILLVDTYDTIQGIKHAIEVGKTLRAQGDELLGVRLDSGDMADLSIKARKLLDEAGFPNTQIIASNSLDEYVIRSMKKQGAKVSMWGVGTNLMTAYDHPALDGVYKLSAIRDESEQWVYKLKLSEQTVKISNPGIHQVRRFFKKGKPLMDMMYDIELGALDSPIKAKDHDRFTDLLIPIYKKGNLVYQQPSIHAIRERAIQQVTEFAHHYPCCEPYPVELEKNLFQLKQLLIMDVSKEEKQD